MEAQRARSILTHRLDPGEKLVWIGTPEPWRAAAGRLFRLAVLTAPLAGVTGLLAFGKYDLQMSAPVIFLFVAIWWWGTLKTILNLRQTAYGLTDRRVIIAVGNMGKTRSFASAALKDLRRVGLGTRGTVLLAGFDGDLANRLAQIENAAQVETLIRETLPG